MASHMVDSQQANDVSQHYRPFYLLDHDTRQIILQCSVPETMPFNHVVSLILEDFARKEPYLSERVGHGLQTVRITEEPLWCGSDVLN